MVVSSCRWRVQSTSAAKQAKQVAPALAGGKHKLATRIEEAETDAESGEGSGRSGEHLHWDGSGEGGSFVQECYGEGNNFVRVPSFGIRSNAR